MHVDPRRSWEVRDVAWQPETGNAKTLATVGADQQLLLWTKESDNHPSSGFRRNLYSHRIALKPKHPFVYWN